MTDKRNSSRAPSSALSGEWHGSMRQEQRGRVWLGGVVAVFKSFIL
jgi:hypothetical protein